MSVWCKLLNVKMGGDLGGLDGFGRMGRGIFSYEFTRIYTNLWSLWLPYILAALPPWRCGVGWKVLNTKGCYCLRW